MQVKWQREKLVAFYEMKEQEEREKEKQVEESGTDINLVSGKSTGSYIVFLTSILGACFIVWW